MRCVRDIPCARNSIQLQTSRSTKQMMRIKRKVHVWMRERNSQTLCREISVNKPCSGFSARHVDALCLEMCQDCAPAQLSASSHPQVKGPAKRVQMWQEGLEFMHSKPQGLFHHLHISTEAFARTRIISTKRHNSSSDGCEAEPCGRVWRARRCPW